MVARSAVKLLVVAGTLVPATLASGGAATAQLPSTTTSTIELLPTTTTTTSTTTTTTAPDGTTTTTTTAPDGSTTTSTTSTSTTSGSTTSSTLLAGSGGGLSISVPGSADLSAGTPVSAGAVTAQLGAVTVADGRSGLVAGWTVTVTSTAFTTGGASPAETIPSGNVAYWSGPATDTTGAAAFAPGQATAQQAAPLAVPVTAFSAVSSAGGTSATWNPGLVVTLPTTAVVGQYHGTITHSVA